MGFKVPNNFILKMTFPKVSMLASLSILKKASSKIFIFQFN